MPSMTMPFVARDPKEVADLKTGEAISFRMTVTQKDFWIDNVKKIRREEVDVAEPKQTSSVSTERDARLKEGDEMPPFSLTNQNGERISLDTFRGQPFVLTFVFTRCPVPNFCPRMSNNFEELQTAIKAGSDTLAKTRSAQRHAGSGLRYAESFERLRRVSSRRFQNLDLRNRRRKRTSIRSLARFPFTGRPKAALSHMDSLQR